jgi:hypothetical protein
LLFEGGEEVEGVEGGEVVEVGGAEFVEDGAVEGSEEDLLVAESAGGAVWGGTGSGGGVCVCYCCIGKVGAGGESFAELVLALLVAFQDFAGATSMP